MIVAHEGKHAAIFRGAGEIGVAEDIAAAIDARALAVPEREDAVEFAFPAHLGLLRPPYGGRGEILVEARLKLDAGGIERALGAQEIQVETAERRAAIARNESGRGEPIAPVELLLHEEEPDNGVRTGDKDSPLCQIVFVVERSGVQVLGKVDRTFHGVRHRLRLLPDACAQRCGVRHRNSVNIDGRCPISKV